MLDWREVTVEEKNKLWSKRKEMYNKTIWIRLGIGIVFVMMFLVFGMTCYAGLANSKLHDILGYSVSKPPEFTKLYFYYNYSDEELEAYEKEKIAYYESQEKEIVSAKRQVKKELLPGFAIYYILTIGGISAFIIYDFIVDKKEYDIFRDGAYMVCEGECIDKRIEQVRRLHKRRYDINYFVLVKTKDGSNHETEVRGTLFEGIKLGSTLLLVHFKKESKDDNINDVYFINGQEIV